MQAALARAPLWLLVLGLAGAVVAATALRYWSHAQRFNRRNGLGVEQYDGYADFVATRSAAAVAGTLSNVLLVVAASFCVAVGLKLWWPGA